MRLPDFRSGDENIKAGWCLCQHSLSASSCWSRGHWREGPMAVKKSKPSGLPGSPQMETSAREIQRMLVKDSLKKVVCVCLCMCYIWLHLEVPRCRDLYGIISILGSSTPNKGMSHWLNRFASMQNFSHQLKSVQELAFELETKFK